MCGWSKKPELRVFSNATHVQHSTVNSSELSILVQRSQPKLLFFLSLRREASPELSLALLSKNPAEFWDGRMDRFYILHPKKVDALKSSTTIQPGYSSTNDRGGTCV